MPKGKYYVGDPIFLNELINVNTFQKTGVYYYKGTKMYVYNPFMEGWLVSNMRNPTGHYISFYTESGNFACIPAQFCVYDKYNSINDLVSIKDNEVRIKVPIDDNFTYSTVGYIITFPYDFVCSLKNNNMPKIGHIEINRYI